jgi:hypothetical protein
MCDETAEGNARARIEQGKNGLKDHSPDVFKIDIDTLRAGFCEQVLRKRQTKCMDDVFAAQAAGVRSAMR